MTGERNPARYLDRPLIELPVHREPPAAGTRETSASAAVSSSIKDALAL
jgi:hypothetical protein